MISVLKSSHETNSSDLAVETTLLRMPSVAPQVARLSYGVEVGYHAMNVSPPLDRGKEKIYDDPDGSERVLRMMWFLKKVKFP